MSGRFAVIGLTMLAFLALGVGTGAVSTTATAEFRVPGLFGGKKAARRRPYRKPSLAQPVRNPDRTFAAVSATAVSPDVAKNSIAELGVGTASTARAVMALPASTRVVQTASDSADQDSDAASPKPTETAQSKPDETEAAEEETVAAASDPDAAEAETKAADAETKPVSKADEADARAVAAPADTDDDSNEEMADAGNSGEDESVNGRRNRVRRRPEGEAGRRRDGQSRRARREDRRRRVRRAADGR